MNFFKQLQAMAWRYIIALAVFCLSILHLPLALLPLGRDQGVWTSVALALNAGDAMYAQILHFNLPGLGFLYALLFKVFPAPAAVVAAASWLASLIVMLAIAAILRRAGFELAAKLFLLLFAVLAAPAFDYWNIAQKDYLAFACLALAVAIMAAAEADKPKRWRWVFAAGAVVAVGSLFKPIYGLIGVPIAVLEFCRLQGFQSAKHCRQAIMSLTLLLMGFLAIAALFLVYLAMHQALMPAYHAIFQFAPWYATRSAPGWLFMTVLLLASTNMTNIAMPIASLINAVIMLPLVFLGFCIGLKKPQRLRLMWLYLLAGFALLAYFVQQKGFPYHAMPWIVCAAAFVAIAVVCLYHKTAASRWGRGLLALALLILVSRSLVFSHYGQGLLPAAFGVTTREAYLAEYYDPPDSSHPLDAEAAARWIASNTAADDTIVVWGMENQIYSLSQRHFAGRHHFSFLLDANIDATSPLGQWQAGLRQQYLASLTAQPPKYFIFLLKQPEQAISLAAGRAATLTQVPAVQAFLQQHYGFAKQFGRLVIFAYQQ